MENDVEDSAQSPLKVIDEEVENTKEGTTARKKLELGSNDGKLGSNDGLSAVPPPPPAYISPREAKRAKQEATRASKEKYPTKNEAGSLVEYRYPQ